jgi:hypothetical protein
MTYSFLQKFLGAPFAPEMAVDPAVFSGKLPLMEAK